MREAVGGSLLLYLIIPIIILFIFFIGFIMNYAAAYRAANYVITQIENCQGQMDNCNGNDMTAISQKVESEYKYIISDVSPNKRHLIVPSCISNGKGVVYRVELPVEFELPFLGGFGFMRVKAETKTIYGGSCSY